MSDILRRLANDSKAGVEVFMTAPPHILAALIDEGLAVVDMSRGRPEMALTDKGREAARILVDTAADAADDIGRSW